ncbi:MAG: dihydrolipoyl dehydrogenase [Alphaproteobacteria bacterium]|nr:dihydrolipoyl dehydrogenase [Alphaproteobacteria bacterium]
MMTYDVTIIGTGPGGYVCAIRAAQLGLKVAVVEKRATHGGTCLNVGCIPSKALLHASELYAESQHVFAKMGIIADTKIDFPQMMVFKQEAIDGNTKGIDFLLKKNKVDVIRGAGKIVGAGNVQVGDQLIETKSIIIATGSDVAQLKGIAIDEQRIVSSTGALELKEIPKTLTIIGAGVIGLELGSVYARLGSKVTVIEYLDRILPGMDEEAAKALQRLLMKQGLSFKLASKVTAAKATASNVIFTIEPAAGGTPENMEADILLVATGRVPYTEGLGCEEAGIARDARGRIEVGDHYNTNIPGIYAIGDVIKGPMLAHKAEDEGVALAEILAGQSGHVNYDVIPGVVYTNPELASVGKTEEELKSAGVNYKVGKFLFLANGRAKANQTTDGFVKILADAKTDRVLGAHIVGPQAGELIHEVAVLMEFGGSAEDLARTCHAHPTLAEAVKEAAMAVAGRAIHA